MVIEKITLTAEFREQVVDYKNLRTDVIVHLDNGDRYVAAFCTTQKLREMMKHEELKATQTGVSFYKLIETVLIADLDLKEVRAIVKRMLAEGDFQLAFKRM